MKKLILVRHGEYGNDGHLDYIGRKKIQELSTNLKILIPKGMFVYILSSPTIRTLDSAEIISSTLGVSFDTNEALLSEGINRPMNLSNLYRVVKSKEDRDIIILVTHFDYVADFPKYFSNKEWGVELPSVEIGKGEAWLVDCEKRTLTIIK